MFQFSNVRHTTVGLKHKTEPEENKWKVAVAEAVVEEDRDNSIS